MSGEPTPPLESLLKLAGERDQPSAPAMERARAAAHASWRRSLALRAGTGSRARSRPRLPAVWAAMIVAAAATLAVVWWTAVPPSTVDVARVAAIAGDVSRGGASLTNAATLRSGEVLRTAEGRVALTLGDALSLRLDHGTHLRLDEPGRVTLLAGAVYVDSGGLNAKTALRIDTAAGTVTHVGTQFQVRVQDAVTRVRVREGRVAIATTGETVDLAAGDLAEVSRGHARVQHGLPGHGEEWEWAAATAPAFDVENRPLSEFLAWLAREHGWQLRFTDAGTQSRVQAIRLHGSLSSRDAASMLERAALVTGVPLSFSDGALWVGARP